MHDAIAMVIRALPRLLLLLALTLACGRAAAAEPASTIIVFDGSGSMWGKIAGDRDTKLGVAREALRRSLAKVGPQTKVGLAAFGHRRKGDCSDTEVMLAPEPNDPGRIMAALEKFNPKGRGPLVAAVKEAAAALGRTPGPASLVVIHDDLDNCSQDPCIAAEEIARANPGLAIHVVSLALAKPDAQRMACMPRITGGRHFDVADAAALGTAIDDALRLGNVDARPAAPAASAAPAAPAPAPKAPVEDTGPPGLKLTATLGAGGPAVIVPLAWRVRKASDPAGAAPVAAARASNLDVELPAGSYVVEVAHGLVKASETVEVKAKGATRSAVALQAGAIRVTATLQNGTPALDQAVFAISDVPAGTAAARTVWSGGADAPPVILPAGTWRISAELDRARTERQVTVAAGALIDAVLPLGAGRLRAKASDREGGPPLDPVTFKITEDDADSPDGRREVARSTITEPEFTLPAGTYYLTARHGQTETRERVLVNAGDEVTRTLILPIGSIALQSRLAGTTVALDRNIGYRIDRLDVRQETIRIGKASSRLELPAGRYRIESELDGQNARIAREIEIRQGAQSTLSFEHVATKVQLRIAGGVRAAAGEIAWEVRDAQNRSVWQALQPEPNAYLAPGRYKVMVETRDRRGIADVEISVGEIKAGETRIIDVPLE